MILATALSLLPTGEIVKRERASRTSMRQIWQPYEEFLFSNHPHLRGFRNVHYTYLLVKILDSMHFSKQVNIIVTLLTLLLPLAQALPYKKVTGTKPHYLDAARRSDFALPLDYGSSDESNFLGQAVQKPLEGDSKDDPQQDLPMGIMDEKPEPVAPSEDKPT